MEYGTVKWYSESRGAGIIVSDNGSAELKVTHSSISGEGFKMLQEGQRVRFDVIRTAKGMTAANVMTEFEE
jgi:CspA family cold shock protein